jgi:hypothetical protein
MEKNITKTELRKNIFHSDRGRRISLGFFIDDEPYFLNYRIEDFDYAENFETLCVNAFLEDFKKFYQDEMEEKNIKVFYKGECIL